MIGLFRRYRLSRALESAPPRFRISLPCHFHITSACRSPYRPVNSAPGYLVVRHNRIGLPCWLIQLVHFATSSRMLPAFIVLLRAIGLICCGHRAVALENLALRQQLAALTRTGTRSHLRTRDRLFWIGWS